MKKQCETCKEWQRMYNDEREINMKRTEIIQKQARKIKELKERLSW